MMRRRLTSIRMALPVGLLALAILASLIGCPGPKQIPEEIPSPGSDVPQAPSIIGDAPPTSLPTTSSSPIQSSEQAVPALARAAREIESALLSSDLDRLAGLAHPQSREEFVRVFGDAIDEMADFGRGFARRRMISLTESQALYSVFVPGFGEYLVELSRTEVTWWLALWTPF